MGWLEELIEAAVEEARERGHRVVEAHHLALALTRDAATAELLAELGKNPRVWRDYINFVLGVNVGMDAARREQVRAGHLVSADDLDAQDAPPIHDRVQAILAEARAETGDDRPVGPAELLSATFTSGAGAIAEGTARWLRLTAAAVRTAAGLSTAPRPLLQDVDPASLPHPDPRGPLVLLGGGPTPPQALQAAVDLADVDGEAQVAWINAAGPWLPGLVRNRQRQFDQATPETTVIDIGLRDRADAHDPQVVVALEQADIVFLDGGSTERLYRALAGTPALDALVTLSQRGGVVVGYSAGTELLGAGMVTGWMTWGQRDEPHPLLGWLPDTVIYPHASGERELERLRATVAAFPNCKGLGIAHGGAAYIPAASQTPMLVTHGWDDGCVTLATADDDPVPLDNAS